MALTTSTLGLMGLVVACIAYFSLKTSKSSLPDGPHDILSTHDMRFQLPWYLTKWSETYGDVFSFQRGPSKVLVLSSMEAIHDLLMKRASIYSSRPTNTSQADIVLEKVRILLMPYGDSFRHRRKTIHSLLGMHNAKTFMPYQEYESRQTLDNLLDTPEQFLGEVERFSTSVTFSLLLGSRTPRPDAYLAKQIQYALIKIFSNIHAGAWLPDQYPVLNLLPGFLSPWKRAARDVALDTSDFWNVFVHDMEAQVAAGTAPECFLSRLLSSPEGQKASPVEKVAHAEELLIAGSDTTASMMHWFFKACIKFPEFTRIARQELDKVVGQERLPEFSDRDNLPYIEAVITEMHRWCPMVPLGFEHATTAEDTYRSFTIPAGTQIIANTYGVHHNEKYFADPMSFRPGRWMPPQDPRHMENGRIAGMEHLNFGFGRRECPGKHVASTSLFILISRVLWAFEISGDEDAKGMETATPLPIFRPVPYTCKIVPRSQEIAELIRERAKFIDPDLKVEDASKYDEQVKLVMAEQRRPMKM